MSLRDPAAVYVDTVRFLIKYLLRRPASGGRSCSSRWWFRTALIGGAYVKGGTVRRIRIGRSTWPVLLVVLALVVSACSSNGSRSQDDADRGGEGDPTPIRFLISPDPILDYMVEEGIMGEYERKYNFEIRATQNYDEFAFFAAGHGDVVSMGTLELPLLEEETGIETVTFGRYNSGRASPAARCELGYETLEDVPRDARVGIHSPVGTTLLWDLFSREVHGFSWGVESADPHFDFYIEDIFLIGELLERGELDVANTIPEAIVTGVRKGEICPMYGGRPSWQIMTDLLGNPEHQGVLSNTFTSTKEFYDSNPEVIGGFLAMWEAGIKAWEENKAEIMQRYPQHFSVEDPADLQWLIDYMESEKDWTADSVYLTDDWIEEEVQLYDLMKKNDLMNEDAPTPEFAVVEPVEEPNEPVE